MSQDNHGSLDTLVQETISTDVEFQTSLNTMSEDDKAAAITAKTAEVREATFKNLSEKSTKNEELAGNYKTRAEKAEDLNKGIKDVIDPPKPGEAEAPTPAAQEGNLSTPDLYALMEAKVPQEDVEQVQKSATLLGKSIAETLQDPTVQGILATRLEHRKTAEAANTGATHAATAEVSDEQILKDFKEGKVPEKGSKEADRLFHLRRKRT